MAFLFTDGFDMYPDIDAQPFGVGAVWQFNNADVPGSSKGLVAGRFGGQAVQIINEPTFPTYFGQVVASGLAFALGFAFRLDISNPPITILATWWSGGNGVGELCGLAINPSQQVFLWVGTPATVVGTSAIPLQPGAWHYLEAELLLDPATGTFTLWQDGIRQVNFAGVTGAGTADFVSLGPNGSSNFFQGSFDDMYCVSGAARVGELRIETLYPASNSQAQWTPLTGSNFSEVNETLVDGDASYVFSDTANQEDLYAIGPLSSTPVAIYAVQVRTCFRKDDASAHTIASSLSSNGTLVHGATVGVTSSYQYQRDIYADDPHTSAAWVGAGVDAALIGQKVIS